MSTSEVKCYTRNSGSLLKQWFTPQAAAQEPAARVRRESCTLPEMGVLMQAFYWDCPRIAGVEFGWWRHVTQRLESLRQVGFSALWLPPCSKAADAASMGYDPFDLFDLGEFDQRGAVPTWFGTKLELIALVTGAHARGMQVYADAVYNHMSGGDKERNPDFDVEGWTRFHPASGRFPRDYRSFHPSLYQRRDDLSWGGMPDLCHRNPQVYAAVMEHANMLIAEVGFDGFRFDFVKGYGAWMVKSLKERRYVRGGHVVEPFCVAEAWSSAHEIDEWLGDANHRADNPISAFDFPLRYRLKDLCDSYGFSLRRLAEPGTVLARDPFRAVTFVDNHDFRGGDAPPIVHDKMLAYAFILSHGGYPCVFWQDYFEHGLGRPGDPRGIAALVAAHERYAGGDSVVRWVDDDLYVMERVGSAAHPGLVFVLNNRGDRWNGAFVDTVRPDANFRAVAWGGHDGAEPRGTTTAADGRGEFWAAPRGYAVYARI
jgi:alpha-amylase